MSQWRRCWLPSGLVVVPLVAAPPASAAEPVNIMPLGDSITEAVNIPAEQLPSYRSYLWSLLQPCGYTHVDLVGSRFSVLDFATAPAGEHDPGGNWDKDHEGHAGWRTDEILNGRPAAYPGKLDEWAPTYQPDIVLVHLGTNDAIQFQNPVATIGELELVIDTLRVTNPNVAILIAQLIPSSNGAVNAQIDLLNALIPDLADESTPDSPVIIVDHNTGFDLQWLDDLYHPDATGQAFMAQQWFDALVANELLDNVAPTADAGPDQITGDLTVNLSGSACDDGLPIPPGTLTTTWTSTGGGVIADPGSLNTTVTFPGPGTYTVTLTADDTARTSESHLTVFINAPPTVDAGPDEFTFETTVTLSGSVTDDGLPNPPSTVTKTWTSTGGGIIADPGSLNTTVTFAGPGIYTVTLSADDTEYSEDDELVVLICPEMTADGYWMLEYDGELYPFGCAVELPNPYGSMGVAHAVAMAATPTSIGYWMLLSDGSVRAYGDAIDFGSVDPQTLAPGEIPASISATPSGQGYWVFTDLGRVLAFGDAPFLGDLSQTTLQGPIVSSVSTPDGAGYYMLGSDGGVFAFGTAVFHGSIPQVLPGVVLDGPIVGLVPTLTGGGYWLVGSDGGVFAFGDAGFVGSIPQVLPGVPLNAPVNGMIAFGDGYLMVASDGGIFNFSSLPFFGSLGNNPPDTDIVGVTASTMAI